jgi:hypothetical protein
MQMSVRERLLERRNNLLNRSKAKIRIQNPKKMVTVESYETKLKKIFLCCIFFRVVVALLIKTTFVPDE